MIKPTSKCQAYILLFIYCFIVFMCVGVLEIFLGAMIIYFKHNVWALKWSDVSGLVRGALIYTVFATIGIGVLSTLKKRRERHGDETDAGEHKGIESE